MPSATLPSAGVFRNNQLPALLHISHLALTSIQMQEHVHSLHAELLYVLCGKGHCVIGGQEADLHANDCILCGACVPHAIYSSAEQAMLCYSMGVYNLSIGTLPKNQFSMDTLPIILHLPEQNTLLDLLRILDKEVRLSPDVSEEITNYLTAAALTTVCQYQRKLRPEACSDMRDLSQRIRRYIDAHYCEPISLHTISDALDVSPYHMSRVFHARTGHTPIQYITRRRIARAQTLLAATEEPIRSIAAACGYENVNYFHTLFHKTIGMTPTQYRSMIRRDVPTPPE